MMPHSAPLAYSAIVYDDVERTILEQEAADPDWHFGFNPALAEPRGDLSPQAMADYLGRDNLAEAQSFAGRMLRRWLRTHDDRRAQYWRDVASALARAK